MSKYLNSIKKEIILSVLSLLLSSNIICALEIGQKVPEIKVSEWVKGSAITFRDKNNNEDNKIYILFFWATWLKEASRFTDFVMMEKEFYSKENLVFVGITREKASLLKKFVKDHPEVDLSLGIDDNSQTYNAYMNDVNILPVFFIIDSKSRLLWKGTPIEFDRVIRRILDDTFDSDKQDEIEKLRDQVRDYSHMLNTEKETQISEEILKLDPIDEVSVKLISSNMAKGGKLEEAYRFIEDARAKALDSQYIQRALFLNELELVMQMPLSQEKTYLEYIAKNYLESFSNSPRYLNEFSIRLLREFPLEVLPVGLLTDAVNKAISILEKDKGNKDNMGSYYLTQARLYYIVGKLDKAVITQDKAIDMLKDEDELIVAKLNISFYKEMLVLNKKE